MTFLLDSALLGPQNPPLDALHLAADNRANRGQFPYSFAQNSVTMPHLTTNE